MKVSMQMRRDGHQCRFGILPRLIGLGYGGTEAYKEAVAILKLKRTYRPRFIQKPVPNASLGLGSLETGAKCILQASVGKTRSQKVELQASVGRSRCQRGGIGLGCKETEAKEWLYASVLRGTEAISFNQGSKTEPLLPRARSCHFFSPLQIPATTTRPPATTRASCHHHASLHASLHQPPQSRRAAVSSLSLSLCKCSGVPLPPREHFRCFAAIVALRFSLR